MMGELGFTAPLSGPRQCGQPTLLCILGARMFAHRGRDTEAKNLGKSQAPS